MDHIIPEVRGGQTTSENLALACPFCNRHKREQTRGWDPLTGRRTSLFDPRRQNCFRHFDWASDGLTIYGRTACGRATVEAVKRNNEGAALPDWEPIPAILTAE